MKRVVDVCPNVFGKVKCTGCKIQSDIGWYKTDGIDIYCPICGYKMGILESKIEGKK